MADKEATVAPAPDRTRYVILHTVISHATGESQNRGDLLRTDLTPGQVKRLLRLKAIAPVGTRDADEARADPFVPVGVEAFEDEE